MDEKKKKVNARGDSKEEAEEGVKEKVQRENHRIMYGSPECTDGRKYDSNGEKSPLFCATVQRGR